MSIQSLVKTIKVSDENHKRLTKVGEWGESMDSIIGKILDFYESKKINEK